MVIFIVIIFFCIYMFFYTTNLKKLEKEHQIEKEKNGGYINTFDNTRKSTKTNGCLFTIISFIIVFILFGLFVIEPSNNLFFENQSVVGSYLNSYDNFCNILGECGFWEYVLEHDDALDDLEVENSKGFRIKQNNLNAVVYIKDGEIYSVKYASNYLYKDGIIQSTLSDYTINSSERNNLIVKTQNIINTVLKSPSTAKYPLYDYWNVEKVNGETIVQGYVDSQNSFGAMIRSEFQVKYKNGYTTSIIFNGEELIK